MQYDFHLHDGPFSEVVPITAASGRHLLVCRQRGRGGYACVNQHPGHLFPPLQRTNLALVIAVCRACMTSEFNLLIVLARPVGEIGFSILVITGSALAAVTTSAFGRVDPVFEIDSHLGRPTAQPLAPPTSWLRHWWRSWGGG